MKKLIPFYFLFLLSFVSTAQENVYFPPEFEKQEGLLLTWDYNDQRNPVTAAIAKAVQPSAKVWIVYYPGTAPMDTNDIRNFLRDHGVPDEGVHLIPGWTETLWIRDYGPMAGYSEETLPFSRIFMDAGYSAYGRPKDDSIPTQLANLWNIPVMNMPLEFEGGNVLLDGLGRGWGSTRIFSQNPGYSQSQVKAMMEDYFGLYDFMFLEKLNHSGGGIWCHVDMFMKILDSETIMISEYPDFVPDHDLIESFVLTLQNTMNAHDRYYKTVRIPAPPKADGTWATTQNDEMRTYTNSIIINDVIVIPSYNLPEYDSIARQVYAESMPGYRLEMVDASVLTPLYGALHCIVKEVTKPQYLRIKHKKIAGMQPYQQQWYIEANVDVNVTLDSSWIFYRHSPGEEFIKAGLYGGCPYYGAYIQNVQPGDTVDYYLMAAYDGDVVTMPPSAPGGHYSFWFDPALNIAEMPYTKFNPEIFPNPSDGKFTLAGLLPGKEYELSVTDLSGKTIVNRMLNGSSASLDLSNDLMPGIYLLHVKSGTDFSGRQKLIIHQ
ncbi:MAG: agmatine deiminase family protein [Bacteroidales bacterium]